MSEQVFKAYDTAAQALVDAGLPWEHRNVRELMLSQREHGQLLAAQADVGKRTLAFVRDTSPTELELGEFVLGFGPHWRLGDVHPADRQAAGR